MRSIPPCLVALLVVGWATAWNAPTARALDPTRPIESLGYRSWDVDQGLPQSSVLGIAQTPDGYLWLATRGGLVRTDGNGFVVYDRQVVPEMINNFMNDLAVDGRGRLWVGTNEGLLSFEGGRFTRWDYRLGLDSRRILVLCASRSGGMWVGTYGGELLLVEGDEVRRWDAADGLPKSSIWALHEDSAGDLWIGTWTGPLTRLRGGEVSTVSIPGSEQRGYWAIHEDRAGRLWVGGSDGLHLLEDDGSSRTFTSADGLPGDYVQSLAEDRDGSLWVGTYGDGLARWIYESETSPPEVDRFRRTDGLAGDVVWSLFEDREGHLWIGTVGDGLARLQDAVFEHLQPAGSSQVTSVTQDAEGRIWVATLGAGVQRLGPDGRPEARFTREDGLPTNRIWAVLADRRGAVWLGTSGGGLVRLGDLGRGEIEVFTTEDGLSQDVVFGLYESRDGTLWTTGNRGLGSFKDGRFEPPLTTADGLHSDLVRAVLEDANGDLWIGTAGGGAHRRRRGAIEHFGPSQGLEGANVWSLHEDELGVLWVAGSAGLHRFDGERFRGIDTRHGLQSDNISVVQGDASGNLWLGTRRGIMRVGRARLDAYLAGRARSVLSLRYGRADGLRSTEIQAGVQPAALRAKDGRLWFPTLEGLAGVDPERVQEEASQPQVRLERLLADGVEQPLDGTARLVPGTRRVEIAYTAIRFRAPERLRFRYRLVGFDDDWVEVDHRRSATFTRLPPGPHTFLIAARAEHGDWSLEPTELRFHVRPRFYQDRRLMGAAGALAGLGMLAGFGLKVRSLRKKQLLLTTRVEETEARLHAVSGLLPMCASCKKIRDDHGYWSRLESFLAEHSDLELTHGLCPDCLDDQLRQVGRLGEESSSPPPRR